MTEITTEDVERLAFYVIEDEDSEYPSLYGPDGLVATLTEPEDRVWYRDLAPVMELLEEQYASLRSLAAELERVLLVIRTHGLNHSIECLPAEDICICGAAFDERKALGETQ